MRAIKANTGGEIADIEPIGSGLLRDCIAASRACPRKRKALAIMMLHDICEWNTEEIGQLFGQNRGSIHKILNRTRRALPSAVYPEQAAAE